MSDQWHARNVSTIKVRLEKFTQSEAKREVLRRVTRIAQAIVDFVDGNFSDMSEEFPQWTANLHDATGVGVYDNGRLHKYVPIQRASEPQQGVNNDYEWGSQELDFALSYGARTFASGIWLVLFSASSYADVVNRLGSPKDRGRNFFTALAEQVGIRISGEFSTAIVESNGLIGFFL